MRTKDIFFGTIILLLFYGYRFPEEKKFLGKKIPDVTLIDASGSFIQLHNLIRDKPLIITPIYTKCPSYCGLVINGTHEAIARLGGLGEDYNVLSFSFDTTDKVVDLFNYEKRWEMDGNHWKTVSADSQGVAALLSAIGFEYDVDTVFRQYNHPSMLVVLTPEGRISRYIYGVNPSKRDIRLAVIGAQAEQTTPGLFAGIYLRCFGYDPNLKTYKVDWRFIISTSSGIIMICIMVTLFFKTFILNKPEYDTEQ
ncbi:MAG: SCO family protein [Saprospiraceae bacterium]|jgi:protein SCO1/2|nr:SCO family protein [Saprospiraceae bacterium]